MGTLPKTFGFENVSIPYCTGKDSWKEIGRKDGPVVVIHHDSKKWLDTTGYELAITNLWMGGELVDALGPGQIKNPDRVSVKVVRRCEKPLSAVVAARYEVNWTCPFKRYIGSALQRDVRRVSRKKGEQRVRQPENGENLLADRASVRSAWQRYPSWLVKFDATEIEDGERVYRLMQCERNAGIQNVCTDAFLRHGNGTYRLSFEARANGSEPVPMEVYVISNEKRMVENLSVPAGGWHRVSRDIDFDFDLAATDLIAVFLRIKSPCEEISFKRISLVKVR
jgi:hypothetical protein